MQARSAAPVLGLSVLDQIEVKILDLIPLTWGESDRLRRSERDGTEDPVARVHRVRRRESSRRTRPRIVTATMQPCRHDPG